MRTRPVTEQERKIREGFTVSRRGMLGGAACTAGAAAAGALGFSELAHADLPPAADRAFLFCHFPGGWDQLMLLDPRDPRMFPNSERHRTLIELRWEEMDGLYGIRSELVRPSGASPLVFGPLANRAGPRPQLVQFADRMAVLRGVNMSALGHEVAYRYFLTANYPVGTSARGSSIATEVTALMAPTAVRRPLPNLSIGVETYNDRFPGGASALPVRNVDDLLVVLQATGPADTAEVREAMAARARITGPCSDEMYDRRGIWSAVRESKEIVHTLVNGNVATQFDFVTADTPGAAAIRARYGFGRGDANHPGARAALAMQAIKSGMSQVVSVGIGVGTDTHFSNNAVHASLLIQGLDAFNVLLADLRDTMHPRGGSFLDHTTVIGFSEFARTPLFNNYNGRDHHQASSVMLLGAGIRGNTLVGGTSDVGMSPIPWDIANNRPSDTGEILKPEHVAATLFASAGLTSTRFRESPIRAVLT
jgi:hypothetical protein